MQQMNKVCTEIYTYLYIFHLDICMENKTTFFAQKDVCRDRAMIFCGISEVQSKIVFIFPQTVMINYF